GDDAALFRREQQGPLGTHHDAIYRVLEVGHGDQQVVAPRREQGRLVGDIGQVGANHAGGAAGEDGEVDVVGQRHPAGVDQQDGLAAHAVRAVHHHLAVEAPGAHEGGVEHVGTVGGGDDDDRLARVEAVHLHEDLVEGLLALVVATAQASAALTAHG